MKKKVESRKFLFEQADEVNLSYSESIEKKH